MEAKIIVEGVELNEAQAMAVRVALNSFVADLRANGIGEDDMGKRLAAGYVENSEAVLSLIHQKQQKNGKDIQTSKASSDPAVWIVPAFVLGCAISSAIFLLGPVAVRDKVIAEYKADVLQMAEELSALEKRPLLPPPAAK